MMTLRIGTSIFLTVLLLFSSAAPAQTSSSRMVKRNIATVLFSTLGGAVLGLSTLPFYGAPQEHTDNISVGALVGFIGGVGYVAYNAAQPEQPPAYDYGFGESLKMKKALVAETKAFPVVQWHWEF